MASSIILKTMLNSFLPTVNNLIESGKIDSYIQAAKDEYAQQLNLQDDESLEVLVSTETDGKEYFNLVVIDKELHITKIVLQQPLTDFIKQLIAKANQ